MPPKFAAIASSIFYPKFGEVEHESFIPDEELTDSDRKTIVSSFPKEQQKYIHYAKPAILRYNMEVEFNGIIACTPHFIGIFRRDPSTKKATKSVVFHIFEVLSMRVRKATKILIFCRLPELKRSNPIVNCRIICATALKFAQIVRRNYMISTVVFNPNELCDFRVTNPSDFPEFKHDLSPSQQYQLTYYAFSTRMKVKYNHEIAEFYHDRIKYEDGVFDFGLLPPELTQPEIEPAILALYYIPYVHGIICHRKIMPWIGVSVAPLVERSKYLRFIHLEGCGLEGGIAEIGEKIKNNPSIPISYYNFSHNQCRSGDGGCEPMFEALKITTEPVFYLNFGCCYAGSLRTLFEALKTNEKLWHIKYLYFNGNYTTWDDSKIFCDHLQNLYDQGIQPITVLGIGGDTNCISEILQTLEQYPQPIEYLSFEGSRLELSSSKSLLHYVEQATDLKVLDLSYTGIDPNLCADIILQMSKFERIKNISIKLNGNDFNRVKLMSIAKGFLYSDLSVWTSVSLADNNLSTNDLDFLISFLWRMENLQNIDLSDNFTKNMIDIGDILKKINTFYLPKLKIIKISGSERGGGPANLTYKMLDGFAEYKDLEILNIANNNIGELGLQKVVSILNNNPNIHTLYIDGNSPVSVGFVARLMEIIYKNEKITYFQFPFEDAFKSASQAKSTQDYYKQRMLVKRMRHECIREINVHRKHAGMSLMLPFEAVPELSVIVEEIQAHMHELLEGKEKGIHNGVCREMGVTLPYLADGEPIENGGRVEIVDIGEMVKYHSKDMEIRIHEIPDDELEGIVIEEVTEKETEEEEEEEDDEEEEEEEDKAPPPEESHKSSSSSSSSKESSSHSESTSDDDNSTSTETPIRPPPPKPIPSQVDIQVNNAESAQQKYEMERHTSTLKITRKIKRK